MYTICRIEICGHRARRAPYTIRATRGCIGYVQLPHLEHPHGRKEAEPICYVNVKRSVAFILIIKFKYRSH